ncbi:metallophosphoesterase family protein [Clostridium prolinivorans]|uniref:metallophosphoesterase family protein n=1 Tax=Clostridium prolinivorans TaxID=2769420 RepID=UPI0013E35B2F|nr:DNA repair exonuclease [Clostridium prolinivorans]
MKNEIKFIHTADIHLGSILHFKRKIKNNNIIDIRDNAVYNSFKKICDIAIDKNVDFIIISGDIYDKEARSVKGNSFFISQCKRLEENNIMVFAIGGNHDPINKYNELFNLPGNVHIFGFEKPEIYEFKDEYGKIYCRIIGQSYRDNWDSRKMYSHYNLPKDNALNIALMHTQLDNSNNYVPCLPANLKAIEGIDYWALGHIHKYKIIDNNPFIIYPGIPQGRDLGEEGYGGIVFIKAYDNVIENIDFINTSDVLWKKEEVDITGEKNIKNLGDLEDFLYLKCENLIKDIKEHSQYIKGIAVRFIITGRGEIYNLILEKEDEIREYLLDNLNNKYINYDPFIYVDSIELNLRKPIENLETLKDNNELLKEISKISLECLKDDAFIKRLGSVWERTNSVEDINIKKLQLNDELLSYIVKQAENIIIDAVLEKGDD